MTLTIDTTKTSSLFISFNGQGKKISSKQKSQDLLGLIVNLLSAKKFSLSDITSIEINSGPGSFTGLRIGLSVANVLGWFLEVPVNGKMISQKQIILPKYG